MCLLRRRMRVLGGCCWLYEGIGGIWRRLLLHLNTVSHTGLVFVGTSGVRGRDQIIFRILYIHVYGRYTERQC